MENIEEKKSLIATLTLTNKIIKSLLNLLVIDIPSKCKKHHNLCYGVLLFCKDKAFSLDFVCSFYFFIFFYF